MLLAGITLGLIAVGLIAFIIGSVLVSKYAFRISTAHGLAALLLFPYTFYFAFFELEEDDKALPVAIWAFGMVVTPLLSFMFFPTLQHVANGEWEELKIQEKGVAAAVSEESDSEDEEEASSAQEDSSAEEAGSQDDDESDGESAEGDTKDEGDSEQQGSEEESANAEQNSEDAEE